MRGFHDWARRSRPSAEERRAQLARDRARFCHYRWPGFCLVSGDHHCAHLPAGHDGDHNCACCSAYTPVATDAARAHATNEGDHHAAD